MATHHARARDSREDGVGAPLTIEFGRARKADGKTSKVAGEIARVIGPDGRGELPSPINLVKPLDLKEAVAVDAVNALIDADLMRLKWRPFQRQVSEFTVDPRRGEK